MISHTYECLGIPIPHIFYVEFRNFPNMLISMNKLLTIKDKIMSV